MVTKALKETEMDTEVGSLSVRELGGLLVKQRALIDTSEARWLELLAEFDRRCGWALDGHRDCVTWLVHHCGMPRITAYDRVRPTSCAAARCWPTPSKRGRSATSRSRC